MAATFIRIQEIVSSEHVMPFFLSFFLSFFFICCFDLFLEGGVHAKSLDALQVTLHPQGGGHQTAVGIAVRNIPAICAISAKFPASF